MILPKITKPATFCSDMLQLSHRNPFYLKRLYAIILSDFIDFSNEKLDGIVHIYNLSRNIYYHSKPFPQRLVRR